MDHIIISQLVNQVLLKESYMISKDDRLYVMNFILSCSTKTLPSQIRQYIIAHLNQGDTPESIINVVSKDLQKIFK